MRLTLGLLLAIPVPLGEATAQERKWLCVADQATGFKFQNPNWETIQLPANGKYLIQLPQTQDIAGVRTTQPFLLTKIGEMEASVCVLNSRVEEQFSCTLRNSSLDRTLRGLETIIVVFVFNLRTGRYIYTVVEGYADGSDRATETGPFIEIGKCSPL